jgi:PEP-CTERM motif
LENEPEAGEVQGDVQPGVRLVIRRRRTHRHRRNRQVRRILLVVFCVGLAIGFAFVAPQFLSRSHASSSLKVDRQSLEASRDLLLHVQEESLRQMEKRPVYPYSVVPGGVRDARELKWAAEHDPVVAAHYQGFDYDHARVVRLVLARTVYVSYRIGNKVYWTRHRVTLRKGETIITDGKMIARSRCANRVEELPQQATSSSEPPVAKFEEPVHPSTGTAVANPPVPFESALNSRLGVPGLGPAPPLTVYDPFGNEPWTPIAPPPLPGVCGIGKKPTGAEAFTAKKKKGNPCGNGSGSEVPEPGTWLLVGSGLALMYWKSRRSLAPV